jgi:hypothetical protein
LLWLQKWAIWICWTRESTRCRIYTVLESGEGKRRP